MRWFRFEAVVPLPVFVFLSTHNVPPANKDKITLLMLFNGVHLIVANHYRNWCKFTQVVRVREGQRRVEPTTQANCKDRPYLWRQIRSSLAKSSEACKAWAPSGDSTASWWCKSRCVRPLEKTCIIQPWFRSHPATSPKRCHSVSHVHVVTLRMPDQPKGESASSNEW